MTACLAAIVRVAVYLPHDKATSTFTLLIQSTRAETGWWNNRNNNRNNRNPLRVFSKRPSGKQSGCLVCCCCEWEAAGWGVTPQDNTGGPSWARVCCLTALSLCSQVHHAADAGQHHLPKLHGSRWAVWLDDRESVCVPQRSSRPVFLSTNKLLLSRKQTTLQSFKVLCVRLWGKYHILR